MKVSYIIATKDRSELLKETLQAFQKQTNSNFEVIIVDDHGVDDTKSMVTNFKDERFRYYRLSDDFGSRIGCARNFGNLVAKGEIRSVCDSDDLPFPERTDLTIKAFTGDPTVDLIYGKLLLWDPLTDSTRDRKTAYEPCSFTRLQELNFIPNSASAYKKQIAFDFPYNSSFRVAEDYEFFLRVLKSGKKVQYINQYLTKARMHEGSESTAKDKMIAYELLNKYYHGTGKYDEQIINQILILAK